MSLPREEGGRREERRKDGQEMGERAERQTRHREMKDKHCVRKQRKYREGTETRERLPGERERGRERDYIVRQEKCSS